MTVLAGDRSDFAAIWAGARGYVLKDTDEEEILIERMQLSEREKLG